MTISLKEIFDYDDTLPKIVCLEETTVEKAKGGHHRIV
jgi:hypothetical protein